MLRTAILWRFEEAKDLRKSWEELGPLPTRTCPGESWVGERMDTPLGIAGGGAGGSTAVEWVGLGAGMGDDVVSGLLVFTELVMFLVSSVLVDETGEEEPDGEVAVATKVVEEEEEEEEEADAVAVAMAMAVVEVAAVDDRCQRANK